MIEITKNPTLVVMENDGDADVSAQEAAQGSATVDPVLPPPSPARRRHRRVALQRPPAKPRKRPPPEVEARRLAEVRRRRKERIAQIDVNNLPEVLDVPELALFLRVSEGSVYAAVSRREIRGLRIGGSLRFSKSAVLESLRAQDRDLPPPRREK